MALVWHKQYADTDYQVVTAGKSIRLYRNGVLHSQWNPDYPIKGNLWELFLLTSIGGGKNIRRVLVLGVGGGAVINLIHVLFPDAIVDAIELDKTHIYVAKKYFNVNLEQCNLIHADAVKWIEVCADLYDLVIDDVFHEAEKVPFRSIQINGDWIHSLLKRLRKKGTLVINFADKLEWNACRTLQKVQRILSNYQLGVAINSRCENRIVHISNYPLSATLIKKSLQKEECKAYLQHWSRGEFSYRRVQ